MNIILDQPTIDLIEAEALLDTITWEDGGNRITNIDFLNYLISNGVVISQDILDAIDNQEEYIPPLKIDGVDKTYNFAVARNGINQGNQSLRRQNGTPTSLIPYTVPFRSMIYSATVEEGVTQSNNHNWDFTVEVNGVELYSLNVTSTQGRNTENDLNIIVEEGDRIVMFMRNNTNSVNYPGGTIYLIGI